MCDNFPFYFDTISQDAVMEEFKQVKAANGSSKAYLLAYSPDWYQNPDTGVYEVERYTYDSLFRLFKTHHAYLYPVRYEDRLDGNLKDIKFDGWVIGGGRDIDPSHYGQPNNGSHVYQPWETYRWNHMRHFVDALPPKLPIFGICYGMQVLNVLFGGTMIQDLAQRSHHHKIKLNITPGSWFSDALNESGNSSDLMMGKCTHHQALDNIAPVLKVVSVDERHGIPHAIEYSGQDARRIFGVQWHPEYWYEDSRWETVDSDNDALIHHFVRECAAYKQQQYPQPHH